VRSQRATGLCGLDELEGHRDSGGAGAGSVRDPLSEPDGYPQGLIIARITIDIRL
jgi:hypothetical protein